MSKILYVATVVKTHIMEFHIPYLKMLKEMGWETAVAAKNDYDNPEECLIPYCDKYYDIHFERNPLHPGNIKAYKELKRIINTEKYDIVHCHTPVGGALARLAARESRKNGTKVFYTAHGFHFYKGASIYNWMIYYPIEKILAHKTDVLITITKEDYKRGKTFQAQKTVYIPGVGVDLEKFHKIEKCDAEKIRRTLMIPENATVFLSVGELNKNKNHKIVIETIKDLPHIYYILCGQGPLMDDYKKMIKTLGVSDRVYLAGYRTDIDKFYQIADIFVFPSLREGLPVALMEAMASGLICVAARNRGTDDLLEDSRLLFDAKNKNELKEKMSLAMTNDYTDEIIKNRMHLQKFAINNTLSMMKDIYEQEIKNNNSIGV